MGDNRRSSEDNIDISLEKSAELEAQYTQKNVAGNGSFGVVYQAIHSPSGDMVAIKSVLQDRRYKNRELSIMKELVHPTVVRMRDYFYVQRPNQEDLYLNVVMEYIPDTIYRAIRRHTKSKKLIPNVYCKVYTFQLLRALAYCRRAGVCHRDIKPQNLLLDPDSHVVKLCDFGSAKMLISGQPNVAYICSRYYRAPELIFGATDYTHDIDIWSLGCVIAEMYLGQPLFPGESGVDQLVEIIKVLGTPTRDEITAMNPNYTEFKFPQVRPHPWKKVFRDMVEDSVVDLISQMLVYRPLERTRPFKLLAHQMFDEIRVDNFVLPDGKALPPTVFNFTQDEIREAVKENLLEKILPPGLVAPLGQSLSESETKQP